MILRLTASYLPLLARFVIKPSSDDPRFYLRGFYAEPHPDGGATLVATDGHRMLVIYDADAELDEPQIRPVPKRVALAAARIAYDEESVTITVRDQVHREDAPPIDGKFPDWKKVFPRDPKPTASISYNSDYVADFAGLGACTMFPMAGPARDEGHGATVVRFEAHPEIVALLLPIRWTLVDGLFPRWLKRAGVKAKRKSDGT